MDEALIRELLGTPDAGAALAAMRAEKGSAVVDAALLSVDPRTLAGTNLDLNAVVAGRSHLLKAVTIASPGLDALFHNVGQAGRHKLLEDLVAANQGITARRLIAEMPDQASSDGLTLMLYLLEHYSGLSFDRGIEVAQRAQHTLEDPFLRNAALGLLAFEFLDSTLVGQWIAETEGTVRSGFLQAAENYFDSLRAMPCPPGEGLRGISHDANLLEMIGDLRDNTTRDVPTLGALAMTLHATTAEWHIRIALVSILRHCLDLGWTDELEAATLVLVTLVQLGREDRATHLMEAIEFSTKAPVTFQQFKRLQHVLLACPSHEAQTTLIDKMEQQLAPHLSDEMRTALQAMRSRTSLLRIRANGDAPPFKLPPVAKIQRNAIAGRASVAVCISGQLRSFGHNWPAFVKHVIAPLGADVFVSTWDKVGFGIGYQRESSRIVAEEILAILPPSHGDVDVLMQSFPQMGAALLGYPANSETVLEGLDGLTAWNVHDEAHFDTAFDTAFQDALLHSRFQGTHSMGLNQLKMFFTLKDCLELTQSHAEQRGQPYELVIRLRPDTLIRAFCPQALLRPNFDDDVVYVHHYHQFGIADQFAFGSAAAMDAYMSPFDALRQIRSFDAFLMGYGHWGEPTMFDHLAHRGFRCRKRDVIDYKLSSQLFSAEEIAALMLSDLMPDDPIAVALRHLIS
jgi:hypothetical protein